MNHPRDFYLIIQVIHPGVVSGVLPEFLPGFSQQMATRITLEIHCGSFQELFQGILLAPPILFGNYVLAETNPASNL